MLRGQSAHSSWFFIESAHIGDINANVTIALTSSILAARHGATAPEPASGLFRHSPSASSFPLPEQLLHMRCIYITWIHYLSQIVICMLQAISSGWTVTHLVNNHSMGTMYVKGFLYDLVRNRASNPSNA